MLAPPPPPPHPPPPPLPSTRRCTCMEPRFDNSRTISRLSPRERTSRGSGRTQKLRLSCAAPLESTHSSRTGQFGLWCPSPYPIRLKSAAAFPCLSYFWIHLDLRLCCAHEERPLHHALRPLPHCCCSVLPSILEDLPAERPSELTASATACLASCALGEAQAVRIDPLTLRSLSGACRTGCFDGFSPAPCPVPRGGGVAHSPLAPSPPLQPSALPSGFYLHFLT